MDKLGKCKITTLLLCLTVLGGKVPCSRTAEAMEGMTNRNSVKLNDEFRSAIIKNYQKLIEELDKELLCKCE